MSTKEQQLAALECQLELNEDLHHLYQYDVLRFMLAGDQPIASRKTVLQYIPICTSEDREFLHNSDALRALLTRNNPEEAQLLEDYVTLIIDDCFDSIWTKLAMLNALGTKFGDGVWDEGSKSNLAKIAVDGSFIKNAAGKIQKPEGWKPPDFRRFARRVIQTLKD